MAPERKTTIGKVLVEEYYWSGRMVVYVDHYATEETFDQAVDRINKEHLAAVSAAILAAKKNPGPELVESFEDQLLRIAAEAAKKGTP